MVQPLGSAKALASDAGMLIWRLRPLKSAVTGCVFWGMPLALNTRLPPSSAGYTKVPQGNALSGSAHRQPSESEMLVSVSMYDRLAVSRMPRTLALKGPPLLKSSCRLKFFAVDSRRSTLENASTSPGYFWYTWVV